MIIVQKSPGWFNVISPLNPDKPFNDRGLRKADAEKLLADLTEGTADPNADEFDGMDWDELVAKLEEAGVEELDEDWDTSDDLREALRKLKNDNE